MQKRIFPTYIVTIPGSEEKLACLEQQVSSSACLQLVASTGVVGRQLPDQICVRLTNDPNSVNNKGALGCFLSHVRIWERVVESKQFAALVIEDDIVCQDFDQVGSLPEHLDEFDLIFINDRTALFDSSHGAGSPAIRPLAEALEKICNRRKAIGTDGYIVTHAGAGALLERVKADGYFSHIDLRIAAYACSEDELASVIHHRLGQELMELKRICSSAPPLRTGVTSAPIVVHVAEGSRREREDVLVAIEREIEQEPATHAQPATISTVAAAPDLRGDMRGYLQQYAGQEVAYFPNPGNAGDSLIACGTYQAFDRANIREQLITYDTDVTGMTVVIGGGGNLVPMYDEIKQALQRFAATAKKIIILPHTIRNEDDLLVSLGPKATIFCREETSYRYVRSLNLHSEICLAHDMAFHIDADDILGDAALTLTVKDTWSHVLKQNNFSAEDLDAKDVLRFLRTDCEAQEPDCPTDLDISQIFSFGVNRHYAFAASWCMLNTVAASKSIVSDRLHVGIAAACVGTPCTLIDNTYHKNRDVYRHSIAGRFPFISFQDRPEPAFSTLGLAAQ